MTKKEAQKILIVEDNPEMRQIYRFLFRDYSKRYDIEVEKSAQIALDKLKSQEYALIITDVLMDPMRGELLFKRFREEGVETPVIFISIVDPEDEKGLDGINNFTCLRKPITEEQLMERVKKIIG
ncbi:MAG: response regulator [Candidatus Omnitrophota bacterium]